MNLGMGCSEKRIHIYGMDQPRGDDPCTATYCLTGDAYGTRETKKYTSIHV